MSEDDVWVEVGEGLVLPLGREVDFILFTLPGMYMAKADGTVSGDRITRAGYAWQASGENIAAGQRDAEAVVAGWLASAGHCATLMAPYFTETGIAFALAPNANPPIYWVQVFAAPR